MKPDDAVKSDAARALRAAGWPIQRIATLVRVRKQTVCDWTSPPRLLRELPLFLTFAVFAAGRAVPLDHVGSWCRNGHPLSGANVFVVDGAKRCRECARERLRRFRARQKEKRS